MKKFTLCLSIVVLLSVVPLMSGSAAPDRDYSKAITQVRLQLPEDKNTASSLGIRQKSGRIMLSDIDAEIIIIEIFSMYCPYCQKHAPETNKLFEAIEANPGTRGKVGLIGIGVGNSAHEVAFFKKKFGIRFPLFADADSAVLNSLPGVRTPYYFCIRKIGRSLNVFFTQQGAFDDARTFLKTVLDKSGSASGWIQ